MHQTQHLRETFSRRTVNDAIFRSAILTRYAYCYTFRHMPVRIQPIGLLLRTCVRSGYGAETKAGEGTGRDGSGRRSSAICHFGNRPRTVDAIFHDKRVHYRGSIKRGQFADVRCDVDSHNEGDSNDIIEIGVYML